MNWTLISFYTPLYKSVAERLKTSCVKFNVPYQIEERPSKATWEANCSIKPTFILETLQALQSPVLWVDADAELLRPPTYDFPEAFSTILNLDLPEDHPSRVGSGTIYIPYSSESLTILKKWIALCDDKEWDQVTLREAIKGHEVVPLPKDYATIADRLTDDDTPVIVHHQASRLMKKVISGEVASCFNLDSLA